jgi:hypothetical protein
MKKIKSIYILFVFAALSSYGLWACTNNSGSETISEIKKPTALDSLPVAAEVDSNFYIKVNLDGKEHVFNYLALDKAEGNNIMTPNLFRIKRCEDVSCINSFYLQAHNFDLDQPTPFTLQENIEGGKSQKIILSFITMTEDAKRIKKLKPEEVENVKITIEKIEDEIYEGIFSATIAAKSQDSLRGSFRMKMTIQKPAA